MVIFEIHDKMGKVIYQGQSTDGLYPIPVQIKLDPTFSKRAFLGQKINSHLWHQRFGHPANDVTSIMLSQANISCSVDSSSMICESCLKGKMTRLPFFPSVNRASEAFHKVYTNVWGPNPHVSISRYRYYVVFVDECTRYCWIYPLVNRFEFLSFLFNSMHIFPIIFQSL